MRHARPKGRGGSGSCEARGRDVIGRGGILETAYSGTNIHILSGRRADHAVVLRGIRNVRFSIESLGQIRVYAKSTGQFIASTKSLPSTRSGNRAASNG